MDCQLPAVLDALSGGEVADVRMVAPPPWIGPAAAWRAAARGGGPLGEPLDTAAHGAEPAPPDAPAGPGEMQRVRPRKALYGEPLAFHIEGRNFTVQWSDATVDPARAAELLAELEAAWTVLVDEERWPAPVSSDAWLLWVILDPELGGSGYTTVYTSEDYPDGYPVTYLNPTYDLDDPAFGLSVAVHELGHMLQYRLRDWALGSRDAWYWEATSEWVAERVAPTLDTYAESTFWYAQWPHARHDAIERFHPYGMLVLNAWLDERAVGFDGIRRVWVAGAGTDTPWDVLVADEAGRDFGGIVADMAAELEAGTLRESALYERPMREASYEEAPAWVARPLPGLYGSYFIDIGEGAITVRGEVLARYVQDGVVLADAPASGPYTAVITAIGEGGDLGYGTTPPVVREEPETCACTSGGSGAGLGAFAAVGALAGIRRRRR